MNNNNNRILGFLSIVAGIVIAIIAVGDLLLRIVIALVALSLINYGLRLAGMPPLQLLIPLMINRRRWF